MGLLSLKDYLKKVGKSQTDAARELGVSVGRINQLCGGRGRGQWNGGVSIKLARRILNWSGGEVDLLRLGSVEVRS